MGHVLPLRLGVVVAVLVLAGCGRRGPLELPPGAPQSQLNAAAASQNEQDTPGLVQTPNRAYEQPAAAKRQVFKEEPAPRPINAPPPARSGGFLLDPLL